MSDDKVVSMRSKSAAHNYDIGRPPSERTIPVEADDALRAKILDTLELTHLHRVNDLTLAYQYEDAKQDMFHFVTQNGAIRHVIDCALDDGIRLLQTDNVTGAGIVVSMIKTMIENHYDLRKHTLGPPTLHVRASIEVQAEINIVSKTLSRLRSEFDLARAREMQTIATAINEMKAAPEDADAGAGQKYDVAEEAGDEA